MEVIDVGNKEGHPKWGRGACEFGYEIIMVVPYVYYLYTQNIPCKVLTCKGMRPFYYFLPEESYVEKYDKRTWHVPKGVPLKGIHFPKLNKDKWVTPPFKDYYSKFQLNTKFEKETILISNKYSTEWGGPPINFIDVKTLDILFSILKEKYTIIYNRPSFKYIPKDHQDTINEESDIKDFHLINNKHPEVIDINTLPEYEDVTLNELQLILGSKSPNKISVQGGSSILSSLTGGTNLVYAVKGSEVSNNSFENWYSEFSGATVKSTSSYQELVNLINKYSL